MAKAAIPPRVGERRLIGPHTCRIGLCGRDGNVGVDLPGYWACGTFMKYVRVWLCADHAREAISETGRRSVSGQAKTGPGGVVSIPLELLIVDYENRRCIDHDRIPALASSIQELGLLEPVGVVKEPQTPRQRINQEQFFRLVYGAHRVAAVETLSWPEINAVILNAEGLHAELAEIDENLVRAPLSALEEAQAIARRKEIYETLHPETKRGAKGGRKKAPEQPAANEASDDRPRRYLDVNPIGRRIIEVLAVADYSVGMEPADREEMLAISTTNPTVQSFAEDTAAKTGQSRRTVSEKARIGREILPDVAKTIAGTAVADNAKELTKLARLDPEQQRTVAQMLAEGEVQTVTAAIAEPPGPGEPTEKPSKRRAEAAEPAEPVTVAQHLTDLASGRVPRGTLNDRVPAGLRDADQPQGAGAWLRERIGWLIDRYRAQFPSDGTSVLAAAVLEQWAAELREGFLSAVGAGEPCIQPMPDDAECVATSTDGVYHVKTTIKERQAKEKKAPHAKAPSRKGKRR